MAPKMLTEKRFLSELLKVSDVNKFQGICNLRLNVFVDLRQNEENQFSTILLPWQRECKQKNVIIAQLLEVSNISNFQAICSMQSKVMMFFVNFMKNDVKPTSATIVAMVTEVYTEKWFFLQNF